MKLIKLVALAIIAVAPLTACADKAAIGQGVVVIKVDGQTYEVPLVTCFSSELSADGKSEAGLIISTHKSRTDKTPGPRFSLLGPQDPQTDGSSSESAQAAYRLSIDGGLMKGGADYIGLLPIDSFEDNKLQYKGQAKVRKMDAQTRKVDSSNINIEILLGCD